MNQWRVIRSMRMPNKVHHVGMREFFSSEDKWGGGEGDWEPVTDTFQALSLVENTNWETMALRKLTAVGLFYFIMCEEDTHEWKFIEIAFGWEPGHMWLHTTLEDLWSHYMILEVSSNILWTLLLGSHNFMVTALDSYVKWPLNYRYLT